MHFVGNIIANIKCEFYFDDVTVTSFIDIKCGDVAIQSIYRKEQHSFLVYRGQKDLAQMPFTLRCDHCIVKSVLQDQQCAF